VLLGWGESKRLSERVIIGVSTTLEWNRKRLLAATENAPTHTRLIASPNGCQRERVTAGEYRLDEREGSDKPILGADGSSWASSNQRGLRPITGRVLHRRSLTEPG
jgi:hypothetical protein